MSDDTPQPNDEVVALPVEDVEPVTAPPAVTFQDPVPAASPDVTDPEVEYPVEHEHHDNPSEYDSSDREPDYDAAEVNPKESTE